MLYRTVYGPELEAIFNQIKRSELSRIQRNNIYAAFVPNFGRQPQVTTQSVDDALAFLIAAHIIQQENGVLLPIAAQLPKFEFRIQVLACLRQLQLGQLPAVHPADPTYLLLLEELYVKPRQRVRQNLLVQANGLAAVQAIGGLNREKLQGWRRVMCYLGLGVQVRGEFVFAPAPDLLRGILDLSPSSEGSLQDLLEDHVQRFLPCLDATGGLTPAVESSFDLLYRHKNLELFAQQDAPSRPFGPKRYRGYRLHRQNEALPRSADIDD